MADMLKVLKLVESGKLTAEEAAQRLKDRKTEIRESDAQMLRITAKNPIRGSAEVRLPVAAAKRLIHAAGSLPIPAEIFSGMEPAQVLVVIDESLSCGKCGDILRADNPDGSSLHIYLE